MNQIEIQWLFSCIGFTFGSFILGCGFAVQWLKNKKRIVDGYIKDNHWNLNKTEEKTHGKK